MMIEKLVEEIEVIDRQADRMAVSVFHNPELRKDLAEKASLLQERLLTLADELEKIDPDTYREVSILISESILDLDFVQMDMDMVSLRLGHYMEVHKLKKQLN